MKNTERVILALVLNDDNLAPLLFENCDEKFFEGEEHRAIYRELKDLHEGKCGWNFVSFYDNIQGRVKAEYYATFADAILGVHDPRGFLLQNILKVKQARAKREILFWASAYVEKPFVDWDEITAAVTGLSVSGLNRENPDIKLAMDRYIEWISRQQTGISLGFPSLDRLTDTFCYGEILSLIGRTTTGKTFLALNVIRHILETTTDTIGLFSMDMAKPATFERFFQLHHNVSRWDVKTKIYEKELLDPFMAKYEQVKIYEKIYSVSEMAAIAEADGLKIVVVDFLGLIRSDIEGNPYTQTTRKITELAQMAKDKSVLVIVLIQLSREGGDGSIPVNITMCRESGAIEEISHFIYGIWQPSINAKKRDKWEGKVCVKLLKNKRGKAGGIQCSFDYQSGRMEEIPGELKEE
jgi:replicative DNA helicase